MAGSNKSSLPCVLGMGTANPERIIYMKDFAQNYGEAIHAPPEIQDLANRICSSVGITRKHLAVTYDEYEKNSNLSTFGAPSLDDRLALFEPEAIPIGLEAANKAIEEWGADRSGITHVLAFSSNGMPSPGLDMQMIKLLKLPTTTKHFNVSYMGCHTGLIGIRTAAEIASANPTNRVLIVCVELNSCQAQPVDPHDVGNNIVVAAIFGDGAAAAVIGAEPTKDEKPIYELHRSKTSYIPHSEHAIVLRVTQAGLFAGLSKSVPQFVGANSAQFVTQLLEGTGLDFDTINWALHPGGKAVVDAVDKNCKLKPQQLQVSRSVLDIYANMGAPTVIFILDKFRKQRNEVPTHDWTLALAFGPGITVEGILLRML